MTPHDAVGPSVAAPNRPGRGELPLDCTTAIMRRGGSRDRGSDAASYGRMRSITRHPSVNNADMVGVIECVTAGEIVARYRVVESWKGPKEGTVLTVRGAASCIRAYPPNSALWGAARRC